MILAIKGHETRGKEVIQLLEMLGGKNIYRIDAIRDYYVYFVMDDKNETISSLKLNQVLPEQFIIYSLEEFREKFPYKVEDKVTLDNKLCSITRMCWERNNIYYQVQGIDTLFTKKVTTNDLQPYKEEIMEEDKKVKGYCTEEPEDSGKAKKIAWFTFWDNDFADEVELYLKDRELVQKEGKWFVVKKNSSQVNLKELERKLDEALEKETTESLNKWLDEEPEPEPKAPILSNRYDYAEGKCGYVIPDGYEFDYIKDGFQTEIILKPKKPTYPKTYEECCKILNIPFNGNIVYSGHWVYGGEYLEKRLDVLRNFQKLYICLNAYWKLAGEEMGLGKPWKPDWNNGHVEKYYIYLKQNEINKSSCFFDCHFLTFPTKEMRDAFCENFKDLINECKELL